MPDIVAAYQWSLSGAFEPSASVRTKLSPSDQLSQHRHPARNDATEIEEDRTAKILFFDRLMAKYSDPALDWPKGFYPRLDQITMYALTIEQITGKHQPLPLVSEQWPAVNRTKTPGAVPL